MSRKRSPLSRLLRLREIREKSARIEMAHAQQEEREAAEREEIARMAEEDFVTPLDVMRPGQLQAMQLMGTRLHEIREAAAADREEAQRRLDERRSDWHRASTELDGAEALEEKRKRAAATAARAAAERALDDLQIVRRRRGPS
jgi:flagellar export protein FliJ